MSRLVIRLRQLLLIAGDSAIYFISLFAALWIRYLKPPSKEFYIDHAGPFSLILLIWLIIFFSNDLYDLLFAKNNFKFFRRILEAMAINGLVSTAFFYLAPFFSITPKTILLLNITAFALLISLWRWFFNKFLMPSVFQRKALFVGDIYKVPELIEILKPGTGYGLELSAVLDPKKNGKEEIKETGIEFFEDMSKVRAIVNIKKIHTVILGPGFENTKEVQKDLYELVFWNTEIVNWQNIYEELLGRVPIFILNEQWFFENIKEYRKKFYDVLRSSVDVIMALAVFVLFLAVLPLVALVIYIESGRPIFYRQKRIGQHGKEFTLLKLRSMMVLGEDGSAEANEPQFTKNNDERITLVGKFIRAVRIDEMPQSINVLRREMNFIGPRPERPEFTENLGRRIPYYSIRHLVKPGITGWAQVNKPLHSSLEENLVKLEYDLFYVKNRSFLLDLIILLKTLNIIIRAMGR